MRALLRQYKTIEFLVAETDKTIPNLQRYVTILASSHALGLRLTQSPQRKMKMRENCVRFLLQFTQFYIYYH